jgi:anti-sigma regulatory factor (Ser/Thr protein kinase)
VVESSTAEVRLKLANTLSELPRISREVVEFLDDHSLSPRTAYALDLVLEEILANVVRYAFPDGGDHEIGLEVRVDPGRVVVTIEDGGIPFDPTAHPEPAVPEGIDSLEVGGRGISLVRKAASAMTYERRDGRNRLQVMLDRGA